MLVYEHRNRNHYLCDETHLNPEHVAFVTRRITGPNIYNYEATTIGGAVARMDEKGYQRFVAWMEGQ